MSDDWKQDTEIDDALMRGFNLALRVFQNANGIELRGVDDKTWATLKEIADGELTIVGSSTELLAKYPHMKQARRDSLHELTNRLVAEDRKVAQSLMATLARMAKNLGDDQ